MSALENRENCEKKIGFMGRLAPSLRWKKSGNFSDVGKSHAIDSG